MSADTASKQDNNAAIVGDAALFTAVTVFLGPLSLIVGPAAAWILHRRRVDRAAVIGWALGLLVGIVAVGGLFAVLLAIGSAVGPVGGSEFTFGIVLLAVAGAIFLAALIALDIDALRDLAPVRRSHARLDMVRLVATLVVVVAVVAITLVQRANPSAEIGDAGVFGLFAGAIGAVTMWAGTMIQARLAKPVDSLEASA